MIEHAINFIRSLEEHVRPMKQCRIAPFITNDDSSNTPRPLEQAKSGAPRQNNGLVCMPRDDLPARRQALEHSQYYGG